MEPTKASAKKSILASLLPPAFWLGAWQLGAFLVERAVEEAFAENAAAVADFKAGNEKVLGFLVGQVMRRLKGKADPKTVNEAVRDRLTR